jgi:hypothetical protein
MPSSSILKNAGNSAVQWYSQAQTSYPAQRFVPYGATLNPWHDWGATNVLAKPQYKDFSGLVCFFSLS